MLAVKMVLGLARLSAFSMGEHIKKKRSSCHTFSFAIVTDGHRTLM